MGKSASKRVDRADSFGATLKFLRKRARLTQEELGRAVGYSRSYITLLERDRRAPDATVVAARFFAALSLRAESDDARRLLGSVREVSGPAASAPFNARSDSDPLDEAVAWYLERSPETALRLTNTLIPMWYQRGRYGQARQLLETVLTRARGDDAAAANERLKALLSAAGIAQQQGDHTVASVHAESAMTLARGQDDPQGVSDAFARLGWIAFDRHDRAGALSMFERQLVIGRHHALPDAVIGALLAMCHVVILDRSLRALFEQWLSEAEVLATARTNRAALSQIAMLRLGAAVFDGRLSAALELSDALLDESRHALPDRDRGTVRMLQGEAYFGLGRLAEAREVWRDAHDRLTAIGDANQLQLLAHHMARVDMRGGRVAAARAQFEACLAAFEAQGNVYMTARCLIGLAECDHRAGQPDAAVALLQRAGAIMRDLPPFLNAVDQTEYEQTATGARL
jgi:transcriptional regulator with XRE-family HTH domain